MKIRKWNRSAFSNLSIMARSAKLFILLLLVVIMTSSCYTSLGIPSASKRKVETHYRELMQEDLDEKYTGKVYLPADAQYSYDWNFYYNSAWWYDDYQYVPDKRARGNYSGESGLIAGPDTGGRLPSGPPSPDPMPHFSTKATGGSNQASSGPPAVEDTRRSTSRRDSQATSSSSDNRSSNSNSRKAERKNKRR